MSDPDAIPKAALRDLVRMVSELRGRRGSVSLTLHFAPGRPVDWDVGIQAREVGRAQKRPLTGAPREP